MLMSKKEVIESTKKIRKKLIRRETEYDGIYFSNLNNIRNIKKDDKKYLYIPTLAIDSFEFDVDRLVNFVVEYATNSEITEIETPEPISLSTRTNLKLKYDKLSFKSGSDSDEIVEMWEKKWYWLSEFELPELTEDEKEFLKEIAEDIIDEFEPTSSDSLYDLDLNTVEITREIAKKYIDTFEGHLSHEEKSSYLKFKKSKINLDYIENRLVQRMSISLEKILTTAINKKNSVAPKKKVNVTNYINKKQKIYTDKNEDGGALTLTFLIDMSGSMNGPYIKQSLMIIDAFARMSRKIKDFKGTAIFGVDNNTFKVDIKQLHQEVLYTLNNTYGAKEMVGEHINNTIKEVKEADATLALTDGMLCGEQVDLDIANKYNCWGIYCDLEKEVNGNDFDESMEIYFGRKVIIERSIEDIITRILQKGLK